MSQDTEKRLFPALLAAALAFIWLTGLQLPELVASHFDADGIPNGHMPRNAYLAVISLVGIGLPALAAYLSRRALARPDARINLPNRDYWLAPERRAATVAHLRGGMLRVAALIALFICYLHVVVVRANLAHPVQLSNAWFLGGLMAFLAAMLSYTLALTRRYRRRG
jgi:uncharacterized membrane protein